MELFGSVHPLVRTREVYGLTSGEDDPEELELMQAQDTEVAREIEGGLRGLYFMDVDLARPSAEEGEELEIGAVDDLEELKRIAASVHGHTPDDYWEGKVPAGFPFNHLINHAPDEGYYLPFDFQQAFFVEELSLGSSVVLLQELNELEPTLANLFPAEMAIARADLDNDPPENLTGPVRVWHGLRRLCHSALQLGQPIELG